MGVLLHLIIKELRQVFRDRSMMMVIFVTPAIQIFVLGHAITTDIKHVELMVTDHDRSGVSRALVERFLHTDYFRFTGQESSPERRREAFLDGRAILALDIPEGFASDLRTGRSPVLQVIVDGQNANVASVAAGYAQLIIRQFAREPVASALRQRADPGIRIHSLVPAPVTWYNPELKSRWFMVPGILAMLLLVVTMMLTSMAIVKEREVGTLEQLMVTPIARWQLIGGKIAPFVLIGAIMLVVSGGVALAWFGVPFRGQPVTMAFFVALFLLSSLGLGVFISTMSQTQQQALFIAWFVLIISVQLSGFFFPIENMPRFFQYLTLLSPLRFFMSAVREIFLKGSGLADLWREAAAMGIYGVSIFTLSVLRFHKRLD